MPDDFQTPSDPPVRSTECSAAVAENRELRILLAIAHAGLSLYTDDGELQDNRVHPFIDFKRDSVNEIENKLRERAYASAKARKQQNGD
jgi:hypothetical protein